MMNYRTAIALIILTLITGITLETYSYSKQQICQQHHTPQECQI